MNAAEGSDGVAEVLEDMPEQNGSLATLLELEVLHRQLDHVESAFAAGTGVPSRGLATSDLVARPAESGEDTPVARADLEDARASGQPAEDPHPVVIAEPAQRLDHTIQPRLPKGVDPGGVEKRRLLEALLRSDAGGAAGAASLQRVLQACREPAV
jgi:hypothetical protein